MSALEVVSELHPNRFWRSAISNCYRPSEKKLRQWFAVLMIEGSLSIAGRGSHQVRTTTSSFIMGWR